MSHAPTPWGNVATNIAIADIVDTVDSFIFTPQWVR
jgi:hypothetical protein